MATELVLQEPFARSFGGTMQIFTAHPEGVQVVTMEEIKRARAAFPQFLPGAVGKTAFVAGSTSGYGKALAIALGTAGFKVIGLGYETPPEVANDKKTGLPTVRKSSPGWYATGTLHNEGIVQTTYLADVFSDRTRDRVIADLKEQGREVDLFVYSIAALSRLYLGQKRQMTIRVIGDELKVIGLDYDTDALKPNTIAPATKDEIEGTRFVMGGGDLNLWVSALLYADRLKKDARVTAPSYIGSKAIEAVYRMYDGGAMGRQGAKGHLDATIAELDGRLATAVGGSAFTSMFPAVITPASNGIPIMLKYFSAYLGSVASGTGVFDDPMDVAIRFVNVLYGEGEPWRQMRDEMGRLRLDDHELEPTMQKAIKELWDANDQPGRPTVLLRVGLGFYKREHRRLFGFGVKEVDYAAPYQVDLPLTPAMGVIDLLNLPKPQAPATGQAPSVPPTTQRSLVLTPAVSPAPGGPSATAPEEPFTREKFMAVVRSFFSDRNEEERRGVLAQDLLDVEPMGRVGTKKPGQGLFEEFLEEIGTSQKELELYGPSLEATWISRLLKERLGGPIHPLLARQLEFFKRLVWEDSSLIQDHPAALRRLVVTYLRSTPSQQRASPTPMERERAPLVAMAVLYQYLASEQRGTEKRRNLLGTIGATVYNKIMEERRGEAEERERGGREGKK